MSQYTASFTMCHQRKFLSQPEMEVMLQQTYICKQLNKNQQKIAQKWRDNNSLVHTMTCENRSSFIEQHPTYCFPGSDTQTSKTISQKLLGCPGSVTSHGTLVAFSSVGLSYLIKLRLRTLQPSSLGQSGGSVVVVVTVVVVVDGVVTVVVVGVVVVQ